MRGKREIRAHLYQTLRITPARAGKTKRQAARRSRTSDHPRACGENSSNYSPLYSPSGSPPRVRGKLGLGGLRRAAHRITPARAGKTKKPRSAPWQRPDHPRACGENRLSRRNPRNPQGSPPRVRGKHAFKRAGFRWGRITPARAGKTMAHGSASVVVGDHPRACGENRLTRREPNGSDGSPPRVRGKH